MLASFGTRLPSVIQLRVDSPLPEVIGKEVVGILMQHASQLEIGCLITMEANRKRLRLLPLR